MQNCILIYIKGGVAFHVLNDMCGGAILPNFFASCSEGVQSQLPNFFLFPQFSSPLSATFGLLNNFFFHFYEDDLIYSIMLLPLC